MSPFIIGDASYNDLQEKEKQRLLSQQICNLSLQIEGTRLEHLINQLYQELDKAGISFKPRPYLSDEWGCPQDVPAIGIPFYLADPKLCQLETQLTDAEVENEEEVMMYLRHEAGHAFNYAYRLYKLIGWRRIFGQFSQLYKEEYQTRPFSARFVRNIPGWYAQKHPDEDFAETFAVWLSPGSQWQIKYTKTPAETKLLYVDRIVKRYGVKSPVAKVDGLDKPVEELNMTLNDWYHPRQNYQLNKIVLPEIINIDLQRLFPEEEGLPAINHLQIARRQLLKEVNNWTGIDRQILKSLLDEILDRIRMLNLKIMQGELNTHLISLSAFLTTLAMNYQLKGEFMEK